MKLLKLAFALTTSMLFLNACNDAPDGNRAINANSTSATPAPTKAAATPTPDELAEARNIYQSTCSNCHKADGTGGLVELDEGEKLKVPSLLEGHAVTHTDAELKRQIFNGGDGMPAFKPPRLTEKQIDDLVCLVRKEFQKKPCGSAGAGGADSNAPAGMH